MTLPKVLRKFHKTERYLVEQLTKDEPVAPEVIAGLTNIDEVFAHFRPEIDIEFSDAEGAPVEENFRFQNVGDFFCQER